MGDAASCAKTNQKVPQGYYNIGDMLMMIVRRQAAIGVCGTCMDARGMADTDLVEGALVAACPNSSNGPNGRTR